jgi:hypothetical protein
MDCLVWVQPQMSLSEVACPAAGRWVGDVVAVGVVFGFLFFLAVVGVGVAGAGCWLSAMALAVCVRMMAMFGW